MSGGLTRRSYPCDPATVAEPLDEGAGWRYFPVGIEADSSAPP